VLRARADVPPDRGRTSPPRRYPSRSGGVSPVRPYRSRASSAAKPSQSSNASAQFLVVSLNCRDEVLPAEYDTIRASQGTKVP